MMLEIASMGRGFFLVPFGLGLFALGASNAAVAAPPPFEASGLPPRIRRIAAKWAKERKLPVEWILATILAESGGNPKARGDFKDGVYRSLGLMQVNRVANAALLQTLGIKKPDPQLFDPDLNIKAGSYLLREALDKVLGVLPGPQKPDLLAEIVRFAYVGPQLTVQALRRGEHPREVFQSGAALSASWLAALEQTRGKRIET
jgi:hypothetical protein